MSINFGIIVNPRKIQVKDPLDRLDHWIRTSKPKADFLLCTHDSPYTKNTYEAFRQTSEDELLNNSDVILTLGGDGSILKSAQSIGNRQIPIMGVNLGGLGFLADTPIEKFIDHVESVIAGEYRIEKRALITCIVNGGEFKFVAFNDLVIDKAGFSRVIEINTKIDGILLNSYIADALILSTPTGSTGYSLSAGGPIVIPQTDVFIINPICPHSLTNRPVVIPSDSKVTIKVATEFKEVNLFRDGQLVASLPSGSEFEFFKADYTVNLVKMKEREFFETLRNKLNWGDDFRDKNRWSYEDSNGETK